MATRDQVSSLNTVLVKVGMSGVPGSALPRSSRMDLQQVSINSLAVPIARSGSLSTACSIHEFFCDVGRVEGLDRFLRWLGLRCCLRVALDRKAFVLRLLSRSSLVWWQQPQPSPPKLRVVLFSLPPKTPELFRFRSSDSAISCYRCRQPVEKARMNYPEIKDVSALHSE